MGDIAGILANVATALGIPIAIIVFIVDRYRTRRDWELETYRALSDKYFDYLTILLEHPDLSTTETEWAKAGDPQHDPKQDILLQMAVNLVEAAFFLYRGHRSAFRRAQWNGWQAYLADWCTHPAFVARWPEIIEQYDEEFQAHVRNTYQKSHSVGRDS
jgi:hypothetical protein